MHRENDGEGGARACCVYRDHDGADRACCVVRSERGESRSRDHTPTRSGNTAGKLTGAAAEAAAQRELDGLRQRVGLLTNTVKDLRKDITVMKGERDWALQDLALSSPRHRRTGGTFDAAVPRLDLMATPDSTPLGSARRRPSGSSCNGALPQSSPRQAHRLESPLVSPRGPLQSRPAAGSSLSPRMPQRMAEPVDDIVSRREAEARASARSSQDAYTAGRGGQGLGKALGQPAPGRHGGGSSSDSSEGSSSEHWNGSVAATSNRPSVCLESPRTPTSLSQARNAEPRRSSEELPPVMTHTLTPTDKLGEPAAASSSGPPRERLGSNSLGKQYEALSVVGGTNHASRVRSSTSGSVGNNNSPRENIRQLTYVKKAYRSSAGVPAPSPLQEDLPRS